MHGPQRIIADGVMPARVLGGAEHYEPELAGLRPPGRRWIGLAGFDVVRGADGELVVLEDNLRTPSGLAYAVASRAAVAATLARRRAAPASTARSSCSAARCGPPCRRPRPTRATR